MKLSLYHFSKIAAVLEIFGFEICLLLLLIISLLYNASTYSSVTCQLRLSELEPLLEVPGICFVLASNSPHWGLRSFGHWSGKPSVQFPPSILQVGRKDLQFRPPKVVLESRSCSHIDHSLSSLTGWISDCVIGLEVRVETTDLLFALQVDHQKNLSFQMTTRWLVLKSDWTKQFWLQYLSIGCEFYPGGKIRIRYWDTEAGVFN